MGEKYHDSHGWDYVRDPDGDYSIRGKKGLFRRIGGGDGEGGGCCGCGCLIFVLLFVPIYEGWLTTYYRFFTPWNTHIVAPPAGTYAGERIVRTVNGVEFAFRWCPPGEFMMGSPEDELGRNSDENLHEVKLTKGFWLSETEITKKQWDAVWNGEFELSRSYSSEDLPVRGLPWRYCNAFCKKTGTQLPTEAQWEYACRAGTTGRFAGDLDEMGWYGKNSDRKIHEVAQKKPHAWGLYDMHGNAEEWCTDYYWHWYDTSQVTDPEREILPDEILVYLLGSMKHVQRGGIFYMDDKYCRSASRFHTTSWLEDDVAGFRIVLVPKE